ncbi:hypothetical protein DMC63_13875 [Streptomyces sp. WAC 05977]|nr:hypothetical protein DMC63_13875 [Streptomyces sp. WAC 05977]
MVFDPELPETEGLHQDLRAAIDMMTSITPEEAATFTASMDAVLECRDPDFKAAAERLREIYLNVADMAFSRLGLDEDLIAELTGTVCSYVDYLVAAQELAPTVEWSSATAVVSNSSRSVLDSRTDLLRIAVGKNDLLRSRATAQVVRRVVNGNVIENRGGR